MKLRDITLIMTEIHSNINVPLTIKAVHIRECNQNKTLLNISPSIKGNIMSFYSTFLSPLLSVSLSYNSKKIFSHLTFFYRQNK